jgi:peptidoglycan/xylan/chitin deacetylase (PgdA/CDA1 family)
VESATASVEKSESPPPILDDASDFWSVADVDTSGVQKDRKLIAFTFDDAPDKNLEQIVALFLRQTALHPETPATATLFCNGGKIRTERETALHAAVTAGFELGNHSQNHLRLTDLSPKDIRQEIDQTDKRLSLYDGKQRHLFRAPYGACNENVRAAVDVPIIDWFVDTLDWTGVSANKIYDTVWENKGSGVIVLMHDGYDNTLQALKRLLPDLHEAGYQAVSVSQMAKAHDCPLRIGGVYTRARKKAAR